MNTTGSPLEVRTSGQARSEISGSGQIKYNSIDIMRLLCAVMVVVIHTQPLTEYGGVLGYFATFIFPRLGVPFFFAVSGYFYISGLLSGKKIFLKYVKRLLVVYTIWSFIYYAVDFVQVVRSNSSIWDFLRRSVINFFISGSHYQLWFFPALIFCVMVVTLCRKHLWKLTVLSFILYIGGCLVGAYYKLGTKIPVIHYLYHSNSLEVVRRYLFMGLPFFLLGFVLIKVNKRLLAVKNKTIILSLVFTTILFLAEIFIVKTLKLQSNIIITVFLYPLLTIFLILCFRYPLTKSNTAGCFCKVSANFMYYSHPLYMFVVSKLLFKFFQISLSNTLEFLLICTLTVLSSYIIFKLDVKLLNKLVN